MPERLRGRFLWHELMTRDPKSAIAFYGKVVGWKPQAYNNNPEYTLLTYDGVPMAGVLKDDGPQLWLTYFGTPNVDVTAREAVQYGGTVVKPAADIPGIGRVAIIADPQGALFVAFTPLQAPAPNDKPGLGDFYWHELTTSDWKSAWTFYQELFRWTKTSAMEMAPGETYQMFGLAGIPFGGMCNMPGPAQWLPYAIVKGAKPAAKLIQAAGGKVIQGPMEVPGGDWITTGTDPQGIMFAVHSKKQTAAAKPPSAKKSSKAAKAARKKSSAKKSKPAKKKTARKRR